MLDLFGRLLDFDCGRAYTLIGCVLGQVQLLANRLLSLVFSTHSLHVQLKNVFLGALVVAVKGGEAIINIGGGSAEITIMMIVMKMMMRLLCCKQGWLRRLVPGEREEDVSVWLLMMMMMEDLLLGWRLRRRGEQEVLLVARAACMLGCS